MLVYSPLQPISGVFVLGKLLRLMKSLEPGNKFDPKLWSKIIFFYQWFLSLFMFQA